MRLVCISDTHNQCKGLALPEGDVLVHAGDGTGSGDFKAVAAWLAWIARQPHTRKILIAGNHDFLFQRDPHIAEALLQGYPDITYLQDSACELEGLRFWGSPWQPWFNAWAFNLPRKGPRIREKWGLIPVETDVLITHGPPHGLLDQVEGTDEHLGCEELALRLTTVHPLIHVFGHIHTGYGMLERDGTLFVNASILDENYKIAHRPVVIDIDSREVEVVS